MDDAHRLDAAARAARVAGDLARQHAGDPLYIRIKGRRDVMVGAALKIQNAIRDCLAQECPGDEFLGEEGPDDEPLPVNAERLWIVDPIDGSMNYMRGLPCYAVSIAYRDANGFKVGVIFDPERDELFAAQAGQGARLNGAPIYAHIPGEGEDAYEQSLIGTDISGEVEPRLEGLRAATHAANRMLGLVILGSPALGLAYVAAGRLHAYFALKLQLWDVAAGAVIVQEAGGIITNGTGGSWLYSDGSYLATNGRLHGPMLRVLRAAQPQ